MIAVGTIFKEAVLSVQHNKGERVYAEVAFNYAVLTVNKVSVVRSISDCLFSRISSHFFLRFCFDAYLVFDQK